MIKTKNFFHKFSSRSFSKKIEIELLKPLGHIDFDPKNFPKTAITNKEELVSYFTTLTKMRKMEIAADELYKNKEIRGFCHLYIGQESIALGMDEGLTKEDPLITAYREHCQALMRGFSVHEIIFLVALK